MSTRYSTSAMIALLAGFVVVASQAFAPSTTAWLAFALAIAVLVIYGVAQLDGSRGIAQRILDAVAGGIAAWTIIASFVFSGSAVRWWSFSEALAFVALAFIGMTLHEVMTWRALHRLPVHGVPRPAGVEPPSLQAA